jgi:preprotein translocase subunit SecA
VEYQREGYDMFSAMMEGIQEESVGYLFNLEVEVDEEPEVIEAGEEQPQFGAAVAQAAAANGAVSASIVAKGLESPKQPQHLSYSAPSEAGDAELTGSPVGTVVEDQYSGISRNEACPCGSGKKYKKCHGAPGGPTGLTTRVNG